jgi:hypothetical protein
MARAAASSAKRRADNEPIGEAKGKAYGTNIWTRTGSRNESLVWHAIGHRVQQQSVTITLSLAVRRL